MKGPLRTSLFASTLAVGPILGGGAGAQAAGGAEAGTGPGDPAGEPVTPQAPQELAAAKLGVRLKGNGVVKVGKKAKVVGTLKPYAPGERVEVTLKRGGKTVANRNAKVTRVKGKDAGQFKFSKAVIEPGKYRATAVHEASTSLSEASGKTRRFKISYPALRNGSSGGEVKVLNGLLKDLGYVTGSGRRYNGRTGRAVLAYRKVNRMSRTTNATAGIFRNLAAGKGGFKLKDPGKGKQIEIDLSRQVMALAVDGKPARVYHVSTGAPATPTVRGKWTFYRRTPGYNAIGMYWSTFWVRGYAIHGYKSVPTHPASHGCVRAHLSEATSIYDWIDDGPNGTTIYTYG